MIRLPIGTHGHGDEPPRLEPEGDSAVRVEFGREIDPAVNRRVHRFCHALARAAIPGVIEWTPAYAVATVYYAPHIIPFTALKDRLAALHTGDDAPAVDAARIDIPVLYGGERGQDIERVGAPHGLAPEEVARIHAGRDYLCYLLGFIPGFPYLGELPEELRTPRLAAPRLSVATGSVAIAGSQTAVYPTDTPGGWNIIGHTPVRMFDASGDPPALVRPGDLVRFVPVDRAEYERIAVEVERGVYHAQRTAQQYP